MLVAIQTGFKKAMKTTWELAKVMIPVYMIITLLQHTPVIEMIAELFAPMLKYLGLPGDASLVLALGGLVNIYAAIGVIPALEFTTKEITILSLMLAFAHSLIMESAIAKKMGGNVVKLNAIRIGMAVLSGFILNILW